MKFLSNSTTLRIKTYILLCKLVKNLSKIDCKYLSQEFDNKVLDLVKQKVFYCYEYMGDFEF